MDLADVRTVLAKTGLPVVYRGASPTGETMPPPLPRIVWSAAGANVFYADGIAYYVSGAVEAALYAAEKSPALERDVEQALDGAGIAYAKDEYWDESEKLYEIRYEFEV